MTDPEPMKLARNPGKETPMLAAGQEAERMQGWPYWYQEKRDRHTVCG